MWIGKICGCKRSPFPFFCSQEETFMNIYVGNLSRELTEDELKEAFTEFGTVDTAKIITDKFTGISRGFGFVEMPNDSEAQTAIGGLNGKELKGRTIIVNQARPRTDKRDRRGGGGFGGRSGGGFDRRGSGGFGGRGSGGFGNRRY